MTILIGTIHDGKAYLGADSLWTWSEEFVREHTTSKFVDLPVKGNNQVILATSGQDKFTQILEKVLLSKPELININDRNSLLKLVEELHKEIRQAGIGEAHNNELPEHDLGFLIVTSASDRVWVIESDYSVLEFQDYVCAGSGAYLGEAAMKALRKAGIYGKDAVRLALETVCDLHPYCGGALEIREVELNAS